jgi:SAM-dependent methyltransferase
MVMSKSWDWDKATEEFWDQPSEDIFYYLQRWVDRGFHKFLDLGCGKGRHSFLFARHHFDVYAYDLSEKAIELVRGESAGKGYKIDARVGDMKALPFDTEMFDCILAYHTIYHTDSGGITIVLEEIKRVLKPGGEIYVTFNSKSNPSFTNPAHQKVDRSTVLKSEGPEEEMPHFYVTVEELIELLAGFTIFRIRHIQEFFDHKNGWHFHVHACKKP